MTAERSPLRLTAGWRHGRGPASLPDHTRQYGPVVLPGRRQSQALIDEIGAAGLTGRGGAGFPTAAKLQAVARHRGPAVVVANGMESEPASAKDQALLGQSPHLVLDGIALAARAVGATQAHLCLARTRGWQVEAVRDAIAERRRAGLDDVVVAVGELPQHYVSSEETSLVHWLNGGEAKPVSAPPRPFERGVGRRPTLISNVETLAQVALIARYGAAWFRSAGSADAPGTMLTTMTGAVARPGVYEVAGGTTVGAALALAGQQAGSRAVLIGGYFGTWHEVADVHHLPLTSAGLRAAGGSPGAGVLIALPAGACGLAEAARILRYLAAESAGQCGPCLFGLPAIADDLAQLVSGQPDGDPLGRLQRRLAAISGRGACRHPDGAVRMADSALRAFAADAHAHARERICPGARQARRSIQPQAGVREWR